MKITRWEERVTVGLIENSDLLIAYVNKDFGGAYHTVKHAKKSGMTVINVANE